MPGRHQLPPVRRPRLRWLAGAAGGAIAAAMLFAFFPASANADTAVRATFSVTGVTTSNCQVSVGGSDVYVKPGQDLVVKSSVVGLIALGLPVDVSKVAAFVGSLTIDRPGTTALRLDISDTNQTVSGLTPGDHSFTWTVSKVNLGGLLPVPLSLSAAAASAGASLHYSGTIHVTSAAARCGIAVQVPSVGASASVPGLPPVNISIPGVKITVVPSVPNVALPSIPTLPGAGGGKSTPPGGGSSSGDSGGGLPVPARIVPNGQGGGAVFGNGGGGYFPGTGADSSALGAGSGKLPTTGGQSSAAPAVNQDSTGKHKTIDLASNRAQSTGQFSVILAIIAIIALSVVAATYARLYLLRREA